MSKRTDFTVSQEGEKLYDFLTGRGRVGRRFGTRFWERESTLGPDRELYMMVCKKWHVAKRMLHAAEDRLQVRGIEYLFDEATCPVPHLGGIERTLEKRNRHRRALMRMLFDYYDTDRLMICLDPANIDLMRDFMSDRANARILELQCVFDDQYLVGHARRVGLATDRTPDEVIERMLPTLRHEFADQSVRIREAEFQHHWRVREDRDLARKRRRAQRCLQHRRRHGLCPCRDTLSVCRLKEAGALAYTYDDQNIFAKILRGEIPNDTVMETEHTLAFNDIRPQSPVHVLVIPKGAYVTFDHFAAEASEAEIADFHRVAARIIAEIGIGPGAGGMGYRTLSNAGEHAVQEVPHYHMHILAGRPLGRMLQPPDRAARGQHSICLALRLRGGFAPKFCRIWGKMKGMGGRVAPRSCPVGRDLSYRAGRTTQGRAHAHRAPRDRDRDPVACGLRRGRGRAGPSARLAVGRPGYRLRRMRLLRQEIRPCRFRRDRGRGFR
jgi:diadenosine tetraphosphate (Ap4A) HIT family hydrolase